jgi:hypothetical protein
MVSDMNISVRSAETYRARVMMKLELRSIGNPQLEISNNGVPSGVNFLHQSTALITQLQWDS